MSVPWYLMAKGKGGGGYKTASGPIVSVNDALAAPLRSLLANIEPVQDLHGYDNPWPAGGGNNKFHNTATTQTVNGVTFTVNSDGTVSCSGTATATAVLRVYLTYSDLPQGESLILNGCPSGGGFSTTYGQALCNSLGATLSGKSDSGNDIEYTTTDLAELAQWQIVIRSGVNANGLTFKPMLRLSTVTDSTYSPYSNICPISGWSECKVWVKPTYDPTANPTATIQLGQTVYGGTLDVTNGVLTVDMAMVDLGTLNWTGEDQYLAGMARAGESQVMPLGAVYNQTPICSELKGTSPRSYANVADGSVCFSNSPGTPFIRVRSAVLSGMTDAQIKTALTGVQFCYLLATPITIPLTPTEISTLQGQNNVWADSGDVTVEYLASGGANADLMKLAVAFMGRD